MASKTSRDHHEIQSWAQAHGATPAVVSRTGGMLRFEFSPTSEGALHTVDWDDFFQIFDERGLELVYDDRPDSRFHKLVYPETTAAAKPRAKHAQIVPVRSTSKPTSKASKTTAAKATLKASDKAKPAAKRPRKAA